LLIQKFTCWFEKTILQTFIAETHGFDFVQIDFLELSQSVPTHNIFQNTDFTGLGSRVKFEHRCGSCLLCNIVLIQNRIGQKFRKSTRWSSSFFLPAYLVAIECYWEWFTVIKNVFYKVEAVEATNGNIPIYEIRMTLKSREVKEIAHFKMSFF